MRSALTAFFRAFLRVFYRRVDVVGVENVPAGRGVIYAANHPNGLVDPLFILCFAPRPVSFLAKAPLFGYPFIGWFARAFESIPVYRKEDKVSGSNAETFARARELLARGGSIAIFPEGTTHSDARLRELKSGAARIALGASLPSLVIVPTGIDYTAKQTFRSDAVVVFGSPIEVRPELMSGDEPPAEVVDGLTQRIQRGLAAVTLQADSRAAMDLIDRAERIFSAGAAAAAAEELDLRRRFVEGYHFLCAKDPARVAALTAMLTRLESELRAARLDPERLAARGTASTAKSLAVVLLLFPIALAGAIVNYPTYRFVGFLAKRFSKGEDEMVATMKVVGSLLLFPLTWIVLAVVADRLFGIETAVALLISLPILGYVALRAFETLDEIIGHARALTGRILRRHAYARVVEQRRELREEIIKVSEEMGRA